MSQATTRSNRRPDFPAALAAALDARVGSGIDQHRGDQDRRRGIAVQYFRLLEWVDSVTGLVEVTGVTASFTVADVSLKSAGASHPTVPAVNDWRYFGLRPVLFLAALPFNRNGIEGRPLTSLFQVDSKVAIAFWAS